MVKFFEFLKSIFLFSGNKKENLENIEENVEETRQASWDEIRKSIKKIPIKLDMKKINLNKKEKTINYDRELQSILYFNKKEIIEEILNEKPVEMSSADLNTHRTLIDMNVRTALYFGLNNSEKVSFHGKKGYFMIDGTTKFYKP